MYNKKYFLTLIYIFAFNKHLEFMTFFINKTALAAFSFKGIVKSQVDIKIIIFYLFSYLGGTLYPLEVMRGCVTFPLENRNF